MAKLICKYGIFPINDAVAIRKLSQHLKLTEEDALILFNNKCTFPIEGSLTPNEGFFFWSDNNEKVICNGSTKLPGEDFVLVNEKEILK